MKILIIALIVLGLAVILIVGNVLIYKWIVSRAMKKYINPHFMNLGFEIKSVDFVGLLKTGDFKREGFPLRPLMHSGSPMQATYVYVHLSRGTDAPVRVTAKINTLFLFIRKVEYSALPALA